MRPKEREVMRRIRGFLALFAALAASLSVSSVARAANDVDIQTSMDQYGQLTVVDGTTGRVLVSPNATGVWSPAYFPVYESLVPTRTLVPRRDGFDIIFDYNNTTGAPRS